MKDKLKQFFSDKLSKKNIIIVIAVIGILCIALSEINFSGSEKKDASNEENYADYVDSLNNELTELISSIDGVGDCRVMITLEQTDESVFAKNTDESSQNGNFSKKSEYVLYENANNDEPILVKRYFPKVYGVVIVCQGGDDTAVRERVISSVSALYDIPYSKISVSKLNG